jgi:hypothetical protein
MSHETWIANLQYGSTEAADKPSWYNYSGLQKAVELQRVAPRVGFLFAAGDGVLAIQSGKTFAFFALALTFP